MTDRPVVLIAEELSPATVEALGPDFEIRHCNGADRGELLSAIVDVDAILVRSATKVDAEALAAAGSLKVVARAGVGLDNVDVKAATQSGVMVVNAPTSNIVSAAELAVALMLAAARNVAPAHSALKNGEWKRSKYSGIELYEKTVGIVGLGRIGVLVAQRLSAFGMNVIAYDPYVQAGRAAQMGVRLVDLDTLFAEADFMSVHLPKTPETAGLIGADQLAKVKPSLVLVNAARGGIVDEAALFDALKTGRIAAAGLDVFAKEPCTDSPLFELENVVATPHLGASTDEAQEKAGVAVARSVRLALAGELVPDAVNVQGGVIAEEVRPGIPLTEKLGQIFTGVAGEVAQQLDVEVRGEITDHDVKVLELAALKGVFSSVVEDQVSYVNAPLLAAERGTAVRLVTDRGEPRPPQPDHDPRHPRRRLAGLGQRHPGRHPPAGAAGRGQRLRHRHRADRPHRLLHLRRPPRDGRHRRPDPRRRPGQHRRHAGLPRHQGRPGPGRPLGRLGHPRRDPRRDRVRHRRHLDPRRRPGLRAGGSEARR